MHLRIAGLDDNTSENELIGLFSGIGKVNSIRVIRDINTGKSKNFAIAEMPIELEGQEAIKKLHGSMLADKKLMVMRIPPILPGEMDYREWLNDNARLLLQKIGVRDRQTVLDYGCGPGIFSIACAEIVGKQGKIYALDTRSVALERLKKLASEKGFDNVDTMLIEASNISMKLADESVEVVLLYDVLQEIQDKAGLLQELYRILKPDAFLSIFPMHMGTVKCLDLINSLGMFRLRDSYSPPGLRSASEVINLIKNNSTPGVS